MTAVDLASLDPSFQGAIPSIVATCAVDGTPNIIYVSHVHRVGHEHVAISDQFTKRTRQNLEQTGFGEAFVIDPISGDQHRLTLAFERRETDGPIVDRIRVRVEGIAEATGAMGTFAVRAALVCRVVAIEKVQTPAPAATHPQAAKLLGLAHLGKLSEELHSTCDLRALIALLLQELADAFGFRHSMLLLPDETGERLFTVDSRGFPASGVGSEVVIGEGLLGQCARLRQPVRVLSLSRERRYSRASSASSAEEIPLPGLPDAESLLVVPLVFRDQIVGLLVVESSEAMAFSHDDEVALSIVARLAAPQIWRVRHDFPEDSTAIPEPLTETTTLAPLAIRYFEENDSIFVNDEYLVKGVAGRILWTLLCDQSERGRSSFTNRELRLDPRLGLSALNDNLEARMLLLRRRLEESGLPLCLPVTGRGRFCVECDRPVKLEKVTVGRK